MIHEKLSWRNCRCPVDLWQPGQIVLKKFRPSKNPEIGMTIENNILEVLVEAFVSPILQNGNIDKMTT